MRRRTRSRPRGVGGPSPRSVWIDGSATLTIEASSMTRNWADTRTARVSRTAATGKPWRSSGASTSTGLAVHRWAGGGWSSSWEGPSFIVRCLVRRPARKRTHCHELREGPPQRGQWSRWTSARSCPHQQEGAGAPPRSRGDICQGAARLVGRGHRPHRLRSCAARVLRGPRCSRRQVGHTGRIARLSIRQGADRASASVGPWRIRDSVQVHAAGAAGRLGSRASGRRAKTANTAAIRRRR